MYDLTKPVYLETQRMIIRDNREEDLESHHAMMADEEEMYYLPDIMTHSLEESREDLKLSMRGIGDPQRKEYFFRIEEKGAGELIGEIGYTVTEFTDVGKLVHLGYYSHKRFWGKGYMTEALKEVLRFAFEDDDVFRVTTGCIRDNKGSEKVMIKAGMIKEADMKQKVWHDGRMKDRVEYRLLREEWFEKNNRHQ